MSMGGSGRVVNSLDFCRHCLSPLATFTSSTYFCEFYTANFKDIFGGPQTECVWQQATTCCSCYRMPQNTFFPRTRDLLVSQKMMQLKTFFFYPPSSFPSIFCNCNSAGICTASQFQVQLPLLYTVSRSNAYSEIVPEEMPVPSRDFLRKILHRAFTHANQLH